MEDVDDLTLDVGIENRESGLDPAIQIPLHPIGRSQEEIFCPIVIEIPDPRVLKEHINNTGYLDIRTIRLVGHQATDAAHNQVDPHASLAGPIKLVDHARIVQAIHL